MVLLSFYRVGVCWVRIGHVYKVSTLDGEGAELGGRWLDGGTGEVVVLVSLLCG
jgi:hypothetical protein